LKKYIYVVTNIYVALVSILEICISVNLNLKCEMSWRRMRWWRYRLI